jgi:hypothetical protein
LESARPNGACASTNRVYIGDAVHKGTAGYGVPEIDIAGVIGIDPKTLRKHYRSELDHGHVKANAKVAENLYRKATGEGRESVIAAIFWLKTRAGWRETSMHEIGGLNSRPIEVEVMVPNAREILERRLAETAARLLPTVIEHQQ